MRRAANFSSGLQILTNSFLLTGSKDDHQMDHPPRTLLYEFFVEPILRVLQQVLDFVS
jgi:hypothetical protein